MSASITTANRRADIAASPPDYPFVIASASLAVVAITTYAVVGAWAMALLMGIPLVVASHLAYRGGRTAAVIAGLLALALAVVWVVTSQANGWTAGLTAEENYTGAIILALGPVAVITLVLAVRSIFRRA